MDAVIADIRVVCGNIDNARRVVTSLVGHAREQHEHAARRAGAARPEGGEMEEGEEGEEGGGAQDGRGQSGAAAAMRPWGADDAALAAKKANVWFYYADLRSTSGDRAGHCHTLKALAAKNCAVDPSPCTPVDEAFRGHMVNATLSFVIHGTPYGSSLSPGLAREPGGDQGGEQGGEQGGGGMRRFGDVSDARPKSLFPPYHKGGFAINDVNALMAEQSNGRPLKDRCDYWRASGILDRYAWNE